MTAVTVDAPRTIHPPIDTSVKLPPSVIALAEKAAALHKAAYTPADPAAPAAPAPVPAAPAPVVVVDPPAPPVASVDTMAQYASAPAEPAAPAAPADDASAEHRFKSMQGRFNAQATQMRNMQQQMAEMGNELIASQRRIEELQRGAVIQRPQPGQPEQRLITDKDRTDFGDEFLDAAARAGAERVLPEVTAARQEVAATRAEVHQIRLGLVYDALAAQIGKDWRNVNRHPRFATWLALRDPISGAMRQTLLDGAMQAADAARVVNIFRGFLAEDAASRPAAPAPQPSPAPVTPAAGQRQPAVVLETLAAPGRASSAPGSPPAAEKPYYANSDIRTFYNDVRKGVYLGRDAEKLAIEQDIFAAQREGRVRG